MSMLVWEFVFWTSSFLVIYPYVFYPLIIMVCNSCRSEQKTLPATAYNLPSITLLIAAYNEEAVILEKLKNSLELDYPKELMDIVVVSDASDDETDQIVERLSEGYEQVSLMRQDERLGKSAGINTAMTSITSDVVVFSDANAIYEKNALRELIKPLGDAKVGYVVGSALYIEEPSEAAAKSEGIYWRYELWIKKQESLFNSVVGGDGAIYAIRRHLFWPLDSADINDFVNPLQIIANGFRGVFSDTARCHEFASESFEKEFGRKRRIVNRSWRAVMRYGSQLSVMKDGKFLFQLISHKIIRWLSLLFIVMAVVAGCVLAFYGEAPIYSALLAVILLTMLLAAIGRVLDVTSCRIPGYLYIPYYFYFVSFAGALGIWDNLCGRKHVVWGHIRH